MFVYAKILPYIKFNHSCEYMEEDIILSKLEKKLEKLELNSKKQD